MLSRPLVLVAGVILFLITVSGAGIAEFALYFLRTKFGFGVQENAVVFFEIALAGVFTQTVVLGALLRCTTEYNVLLLSVTCYALQAFGYAVAEEAWVVFAYPVAYPAQQTQNRLVVHHHRFVTPSLSPWQAKRPTATNPTAEQGA